jgi:hypothetical protein
MAKKPDREALCRELLTLCKRNAEDDARRNEIKAELKGDADENYKIKIPGLGVVKVSAPKDKSCTGTAPEIVVEAFLALPNGQKEKLLERGVVKIAEQWTGTYYGSVTAELF